MNRFQAAVGFFLALATPVQAASSVTISGTVKETFDSGGYTYVQVATPSGSEWVAVPPTQLSVGQAVSVKPQMEMRDFKSSTLKRTFAHIYFAESLAPQAPAPASPPKKILPPTHQGSGSHAQAPVAGLRVSKAAAADAATIAELYARRGELEGKTVCVRAQVTKVSPQIMDRNWIHLQDGTGDPRDGSHDLTVTSKALPAVKDIVTMRGVLRKDKDFGSGYRYAVLIEEAKLQ